jgi:hypothetical protein
MKQTRDPATSDRPPAPTGRDGAIDFVAHDAAVHAGDAHVPDQADRFDQLMGAAIIQLWSELPRDIQELLFERALALAPGEARDEMLRDRLAKFLHDRHPRTAR